MTSDRDFKKLVRARAAQTGERYTEARDALRPIAGGQDATSENVDPAQCFAMLHERLSSVVRGKDDLLWIVLIALFAKGALLFEDVSGMARSLIVRVLAQSIGATHVTVRGAPDTSPEELREPADILEIDDLVLTSDAFRGALYEVIDEGSRFVVANFNPVMTIHRKPENWFTDTLLERFMFKLRVGYPDAESEAALVSSSVEESSRAWEPLLSVADVRSAQAAVSSLPVPGPVARRIVEVVQRTRRDPALILGASPRATVALSRAAAASALVAGRDEVSADDVEPLLEPALRHRCWLTQKAIDDKETINEVLERVTA